MPEDKKPEIKEQKTSSKSPKKTLVFIGLVFILVLSVVSFVFIPVVGTSYSSQKEPEFGKWGKTPITFVPGSYFAKQIESYTRYMEQNGQKINSWIRSQIWYQAYNMTLVRTGIKEQLADAGYIVPEEAVNKALLGYYIDRNTGKFSQELYAMTPENERASRRKLMEEDLAVQTYAEDLCGAIDNLYGLKDSTKEIDMVRSIGKTERSFYLAAFPIKNYPQELTVSYGKENAAKFVKLNASIVTTATQKDAEAILARITNNEITFEDAVAEYSTGSRGNAEGKVTQSYAYQYESFLSEEDLNTLITLETSSLSPIMKIGSNDEYGFFRINEASIQPDFTAAEIIATVTAYMNANDRGKIEDFFVSQARDFVLEAKKQGFAAACTQRGVEQVEVPFFTLNYNNSSLFTQLPSSTVKELSDVQNNEDFFTQAFSIKGSEVSEPIITNSNVLVLTLKEERPAGIAEGFDSQYKEFCSNAANSQMMASYMESPKHKDNFFAAYIKYFPGE